MPDSFASVAKITLIAFAVAAIVTPLVRMLARKLGAVAQPKSDRWHSRPTAMMGGIAIFVAVMVSVIAFAPHSRDRWVVIAASALLFAVGLVDDFLHIKPYQKLIGEIAGAAAVIYAGLVLPWTGSPAINMAITFVWLIGITNAVNMLDNMDGLSAGVSAIAAVFLAINFAFNGQYAEALMLAGFAGALLGFLVYNHNPASIFMGDCGALFIGFFLSSIALLSGSGGGRSRSLIAVLAVPVLVLGVPIFDTTFVTLMRKLAGRAASQGGRDHTSHRLVALGINEKRAVWLLYALAISSGTLALIVRHAAIDVSVASISVFIVIMTLVGIHLGRVRVYDESEVAAAREKPLVAFLVELTHKRRIFEVALDTLLISLAYYLAYALKFGPFHDSGDWRLFLQTVPVIVAVKLVSFIVSGLYRGIWRYASLSTVMTLVRSVALSSLLSVLALVFAFRFDGFSRTVMALDAVLMFVVLTASRFSFRVLRRLFPHARAADSRRVLIYGAGDGGELVLRELVNNPALRLVPVGFMDDDPTKAGRLIHGLRVHFSATHPIALLCRQLAVDEVLISTAKLTQERLIEIVGECEAGGVAVQRAGMTFEPISAASVGWVMPSDPGTVPPGATLIAPKNDIPLLDPHGRATTAGQRPLTH